MKKVLYLIIIVSVFSSCKTKTIYNQIRFDEKSNSDILYGYTNINGFTKEPFIFWYDAEYNSYQADMQTLEKINKETLEGTKITIVMGAWCSDSQREIPRFIKIMNSIGYDLNSITIINVDRKKQAEKTPVKKLKIEKVPTIIFNKDKKELGRIIESPNESLEKDMVKIIGQ